MEEGNYWFLRGCSLGHFLFGSIECLFLLVKLLVLVIIISHDIFGCEGKKVKKEKERKENVVVPGGGSGSVDRRWLWQW